VPNLTPQPTFKSLFLSFLKLGLTAFGGPAMIAYMRDMSVVRNKWIDDKAFKDGVVLSQFIPGATAMQTAAYVGFRLKGIPGALAAFSGFGLPAFVLMLLLSSLYVKYHSVPHIISLFSGLQVVVVAIIVDAIYYFSKSSFKSNWDQVIAIAAVALFGAGLSPFIVIFGAALAGILFYRNNAIVTAAKIRKSTHFAKQFLALFVVIASVLVGLYLADLELFNLAALMMKIDLFAFGGGFASVPLMLHEIVNVRGWMEGKTFMDGIALGQLTPGPIIITSTFVGYLMHGIGGAVIATIAVFTPSFIILILATPFFDKLKISPYFARATKGILASFIGLLLFVCVKFAMAVPWDVPRALLAIAVFGALLSKMDILYIILTSSVVSIFMF
jgi:chromate transporter